MKRAIGEYLEVDESRTISCKKCGNTFCSINENYKNYTLMRETPLSNLGDEYSKTERFCFREFYCPGCLTLLWVDMSQRDLPILFDHELR